MKKNMIALAASSMITASTLSADFLGLELGYNIWNERTSGTYNNQLIQNDLGLNDKENNQFYYAYFDHFVPLIPNVKVQKTNLTHSNAVNKLTLDQTDLTLYYRMLDNWANLDLGLTVRQFQGEMNDNKFDTKVPLAYAKARVDLPFSDLSFEADVNYLSFSDYKVTDMKAGIVYKLSYGFGATIGYRKEDITLEDVDNVNISNTTKGIYSGIFLHF
ncbi:MAG: TIGR04219 family outer membrane beta-barrel protein [Campylobacterota bacterium]|nr:TIGR04219 family outer membrane beta-barrel protein [Campylobacterota bacterium]